MKNRFWIALPLIACFALVPVAWAKDRTQDKVPAQSLAEETAEAAEPAQEDLSLEELAAQEAPGAVSDKEEAEAADPSDQEMALVPEAAPAVSIKADDIPTYSNKKIEAFIHMYTNRKRDVFEQAVERSAVYLPMIERIFREEGIPGNLAFLAVVESNFNPNARSRANAVGMWQFMSHTGRLYGLTNSWWHDERFDPEKSTRAAAKHLKDLYAEFGEWELVLAAYNSGAGRVRRAVKQAKRKGLDTDYWSLKLPRETRGYVPAFFAAAILFNSLEAYGFTPAPQPETRPERFPLDVPGGVTLAQVAEITGFEETTLVALNPSIPKGLTPAHLESYEINVPKPYQVQGGEFAELASSRSKFWKYHTVHAGDTLWRISKQYGVPISEILAFNQLSPKRRNLRANQQIMLPVPNDYVLPHVYAHARRVVAEQQDPDREVGNVTYHKVQPGETLWSISLAYKVSLAELKRWNARIARRWNRLQVGDQVALQLPGGGSDT